MRDLDLEIPPGEVFGLLGPNGSGKSTTIKILLGLLYPTRGWAALFGQPPTDVVIKNRIGFLPEESYLYPFLDARETLDFYGRLFRQPRRERSRRVEMLLDMVGLTREARRRVGEYSKGMARRIGLAQALINDPDLLILDEPTSGLDPIGTRLIKDLISDLGRRGKTIILSSHLLADVEDVCDRVAILYGGLQRALGRTHDLLSRSELTQITVEKLDAETIENVRRVLTDRGYGLDMKVTSPADKLENLFLRIVRQAQAEHVETSGVAQAGGLPDFLRGEEEGERLVDSLVAAAHEPPAQPRAAPAPAPEAVQTDEEVLSSLMTPQEQPAPTERPEQELPASRPTEEADRAVIDSLLPDKPQDHAARDKKEDE